MAADSDGSLQAVVICEGDLHDPDFPKRLKTLLGKLTQILAPKPKRRKKCIKVNKVQNLHVFFCHFEFIINALAACCLLIG